MCSRRRAVSRVTIALTALTLLAGITPPAFSQAGYDWELRITEKEGQLTHAGDPAWEAALMYDNGFTRMFHRNMPVLELTNDSVAGSPAIDRFELTIGDTRFHFSDEHFGEFAPLSSSTPGFDLNSSVAAGGDRLVVEINKPDGTGLAVGEVVRFCIQLGVDAGFNFFSYPDYRTVLFDMNGVSVYQPDATPPGSADNARGTAFFADGQAIGPKAFDDETVTGNEALFFNGTFPRHSMSQGIDIFEVDPTAPIPEPGSALLAFAALAGGLALTARRRR
jgi:hypothetical protein